MDRIHVRHDMAFGGYAFFWTSETPNGRFVKEVTTKEIKIDNSIYTPPSILFEEEQAQQLINELWNAGLRPKDGEGTLAQTKATDSHLQDLRKLVSKAYKVDF